MTYYYDLTGANGCFGILPEPGATVILTGTEIHREPARYRGVKSEQFIRDYDFHFWFDNEEPDVDFYAVPMIEMGGYDSRGGLFVGSYNFTLSKAEPLYYIAQNRNCFLITQDSREFLSMGHSWQERMIATDVIELFPSKEEARKKYNIRDVAPWEDEK